MSIRTRKVIAFALAAWFLLVGSGYAAAFGTEAQHDVAWSHEDASGKTPDGVAHGCMGHLSAHILALEPAPEISFAGPCSETLPSHPDARAARWQTDPFSPPPDSLA